MSSTNPSLEEHSHRPGWQETVREAGQGIGVGLAIAIMGFYLLSDMPQMTQSVFPRTLTLQAVTLAVALLYGGWLVARRRLPSGGALGWAVVLLVGAYLLATVASVDWRVSLEATLRVLMMLVVFVAAAEIGFVSTRTLERSFMLVGGIASLYALWVVGVDYAEWLRFASSVQDGFTLGDLIPPTVPRVHGVSDHPNILGMVLVMVVPFYIKTLYRPYSNWERAAAAVALLVAGLALFLTLSRGAWVGAAVAVLGMTLGLFLFERRGRGLRLLWGGVAAVRRRPALLILVALSAAALVAILGAVTLARWESRPQWLFHGSLSARYDVMDAGRDMFRDHLLVGAGPGTYGLLYPSYSGKHPVYGFHAHNGYIQAGVEIGLVGIAVLALGGVVVAWLLWRAYCRGDPGHKLLAMACAAALAGFLIHNVADAANLWKAPLAALAVVVALAVRNRQEAEPDSVAPGGLASQGLWARRIWRLLPRAVLLVTLIVIFPLWGWLDAAHCYYSRSVDSARHGRLDEAVREGRRAVQIDPSLAIYQLTLGVNEFLASGKGARAELLADSIKHLRRATELDPRGALGWANLAQVLVVAGEEEEAKSAALQAGTFAGSDAPTLLAAGTVLEDLGEEEEAIKTYALALSVGSSFADSRFWAGSEFRQEHYLDIVDASPLARSSCAMGDLLTRSPTGIVDEAAGELEKLRESCAYRVFLDPYNLVGRVQLANILMALERHSEAFEHLQFALDRQPDLGPARTALGKWYAAGGELEEARRQWLLAGQLSQPEALVLLGDSYLPGEVPAAVVERLEDIAPVFAGGILYHASATVYFRMKFGREPPSTSLIPGPWETALPGEYVMAREALARWRAAQAP